MIEVLGMFQFIGERLGKYETGPLTDDQAALRAIIERRVYAFVAPKKDPDTKQPPDYPLVTLSNITSNNIKTLEGETVYVNALVDVKTSTDKGLGSLGAPCEYIHRLLKQTHGDVWGEMGGVHIMECNEEDTVILPAVVDGNTIYHSIVQPFRIRAHRIDQSPL